MDTLWHAIILCHTQSSHYLACQARALLFCKLAYFVCLSGSLLVVCFDCLIVKPVVVTFRERNSSENHTRLLAIIPCNNHMLCGIMYVYALGKPKMKGTLQNPLV